jgi:hypothetical protein
MSLEFTFFGQLFGGSSKIKLSLNLMFGENLRRAFAIVESSSYHVGAQEATR